MSLISEALKRARLEAAHQEAAREGRTYAPPLHVPERRRRWPMLLAGILAGALLVGAVAGGAYWALGRRAAEVAALDTAEARRPVPPAAPAPAPPLAPEPEAVPRPPAVEPARPRAAPAPAPRETRPAAVPEPKPEPPPTTPRRPPSAPVPETAPPREASPQPSEPAQPVAPAPAADAPSYVREVVLPGGAKLALSGIAYSETQPVALINGRVVGQSVSSPAFSLHIWVMGPCGLRSQVLLKKLRREAGGGSQAFRAPR